MQDMAPLSSSADRAEVQAARRASAPGSAGGRARLGRRKAPAGRGGLAALVAFLTLLVVALTAGAARADTWRPPPLAGHVVDQAGALTRAEARELDHKLSRVREQTGFAVVVYLLAALPDGLTIEDVGYTAGNAWGVGSKDGDDGVLLLASLGDRTLRIETGRGVGGALTDLDSSRINREVIGPLMREGRTYEAMSRGVDAIVETLKEGTPGGVSEPGLDPSAAQRPATMEDHIQTGVLAIVLVVVIVLSIVSPTFRHVLFFLLSILARSGGGGRGGGGGSGYGGGGGRFGGGGSSDRY